MDTAWAEWGRAQRCVYLDSDQKELQLEVVVYLFGGLLLGLLNHACFLDVQGALGAGWHVGM